jgi:hypothetical protein
MKFAGGPVAKGSATVSTWRPWPFALPYAKAAATAGYFIPFRPMRGRNLAVRHSTRPDCSSANRERLIVSFLTDRPRKANRQLFPSTPACCLCERIVSSFLESPLPAGAADGRIFLIVRGALGANIRTVEHSIRVSEWWPGRRRRGVRKEIIFLLNAPAFYGKIQLPEYRDLAETARAVDRAAHASKHLLHTNLAILASFMILMLAKSFYRPRGWHD